MLKVSGLGFRVETPRLWTDQHCLCSQTPTVGVEVKL